MANIKKISFERVGRNEGCTCDRCGKYIQNIVTVSFTDGVNMNYGIDCFDKLKKSANLTTQGKKILKKAVEKIEWWTIELEKWQSGEYTAENRIDWQNEQEDKTSAWYGESFESYKTWMIEKFICPGMIHSELFETEEEARAFASNLKHLVSIGQTWDIWNWTERQKKQAKPR